MNRAAVVMRRRSTINASRYTIVGEATQAAINMCMGAVFSALASIMVSSIVEDYLDANLEYDYTVGCDIQLSYIKLSCDWCYFGFDADEEELDAQ